MILLHRVLGEIILERAHHAGEGLGGIFRALEVSIEFDQCLEAQGDGGLFGLTIEVESTTGGFEARSIGTTSVKVD